MSIEHVERRLAAILAADVVGYSRLMGANEVQTLGVLREHRREFFDPTVAKHGGEQPMVISGPPATTGTSQTYSRCRMRSQRRSSHS